jgi:hypothetical protein
MHKQTHTKKHLFARGAVIGTHTHTKPAHKRRHTQTHLFARGAVLNKLAVDTPVEGLGFRV